MRNQYIHRRLSNGLDSRARVYILRNLRKIWSVDAEQVERMHPTFQAAGMAKSGAGITRANQSEEENNKEKGRTRHMGRPSCRSKGKGLFGLSVRAIRRWFDIPGKL